MSKRDLLRLLSGMSEDDDTPARVKILPEAAVMELQAVFAAYSQPNPFKAGDLVTMRPSADMKGAGEPHIVLEVRGAEPNFDASEPGTNSFGLRFNTRVASVASSGQIPAHWVEHFRLEPYSLPA